MPQRHTSSDTRAPTSNILRTFGITADGYQPISRTVPRQQGRTHSPSSGQPARDLIARTTRLAQRQGILKATTQHLDTTIFAHPPEGFIDSVKSDRVSQDKALAAFHEHREED